MGRLTVLKQIASDLASQFGPDCEIVIHDLKTNDPEHSIVYIENGHVTGRGIGDGPSNAVFDVIRHNNKKGIDPTDELLMVRFLNAVLPIFVTMTAVFTMYLESTTILPNLL